MTRSDPVRSEAGGSGAGGSGGGVPLVEVVRSGVVESGHRGHVVVLDADGAVVLELGRPRQPVFPRSANKPLQAVGLLAAGLVVTDAQLALTAASHSGEPRHVDVARSILAGAGLTESDLGCPPDLPLGEAARRDVLAAGEPPRRIYMNCSGKHAGMLKACRDVGRPITGYLEPDHPVQRTLADAVRDLTGDPIAAIGIDGCGAPVFAVSLLGLARGFAALAGATDGPHGRVAAAMRGHPDLVGGTGRPVTALLAGVPGLVAKDGAEGVWAAAHPGVGAVAVKIDDGAMRAADRVVARALRWLGLDADALDRLAEDAVLGAGRRVGTIRVREGVFPST